MAAYSYLMGASAAGGGQPDTGQKVTIGPIDTTGATLIVLGVAWSSLYDTSDVVDSFGNLYTRDAFVDNDTASSIFTKFSPTVGAGHTIYLNASLQPGLSALMFTGGASSVAAPSTTAHSGSSGVVTIQPGALTPTAVGQVLISHCALHGNGPTVLAASMAVDSPFTAPSAAKTPAVLAGPLGRPNYGSMMAYAINPALSAQNPTFTWTGSVTAAATMIRLAELPFTGELKLKDGLSNPATTSLKTINGMTLAQMKRVNGLLVN